MFYDVCTVDPSVCDDKRDTQEEEVNERKDLSWQYEKFKIFSSITHV